MKNRLLSLLIAVTVMFTLIPVATISSTWTPNCHSCNDNKWAFCNHCCYGCKSPNCPALDSDNPYRYLDCPEYFCENCGSGDCIGVIFGGCCRHCKQHDHNTLHYNICPNYICDKCDDINCRGDCCHWCGERCRSAHSERDRNQCCEMCGSKECDGRVGCVGYLCWDCGESDCPGTNRYGQNLTDGCCWYCLVRHGNSGCPVRFCMWCDKEEKDCFDVNGKPTCPGCDCESY